VQFTPSAALKFCMMGRICCPVMSFGKNCRFFGVGTCGPPPRPPPPWGAAPPARPPPAGARCAEIVTVTSKTPMSADTIENRCITPSTAAETENVRESYRKLPHSVDAFAELPVAWVGFALAGVPHRLKIHEYQAKSVLARFGVPVPRGEVIFNAAEAAAVAERLGGSVVVVKAQIHAGGRGKGGGVKLAKSPDEAERIARQMIGMTLVTHQTGPEGRKVGRVLIEEGVQIERELYLSMLIDRAAGRPVVIASAAGGMDIEEVAATHPEKILREHIDPATGVIPFQARKLAFAMGLEAGPAGKMVKGLDSIYRAFIETDASMIEINPLILTKSGDLLALDAKVTFDDNALYRHADLKEFRDLSEEDPLEVEASKFSLNYIRLDGNIGCMVNGAGLAMATMDIIK